MQKIIILSYTHKKRLHFSLMYFKWNTSFTGHRQRTVRLPQRKLLLRSTANSTVTTCSKICTSVYNHTKLQDNTLSNNSVAKTKLSNVRQLVSQKKGVNPLKTKILTALLYLLFPNSTAFSTCSALCRFSFW
jgi:hypothetical protein